MEPERYKEIDDLFQAALERAPEERMAFLDRSCAGDPALRREIDALLSSDELAKSFIETPASELGPELLANESKLRQHETVEPYKITGQLGSGGMGHVYLAQDTRLGRRVALKVLDHGLVGNTESRRRFVREAQLASTLDHPNICTIFEVGEADDQCFIGMQYVEGKTLKETIHDQALPVEQMVSISLEVADALATAHRQGIVHRDIKSSNILITPRGQAKVLDFGIAKPLQEGPAADGNELTRTGTILGTAAYMSPEQARGERVDQRSDIFSFGVVMYEMATGQLPFQERSQPEVMNAVINKQQIAAFEGNKELPVEMSKVIDCALAKQPEDRYQSAEELIAALSKVRGDLTSSKSEAPTVLYAPSYKVSTPLSRLFQSAVAKVLLASFVIVALTATLYFLWPTKTAPAAVGAAPIRSIAVLPFKPLAEQSHDEALELGMADTLITRLGSLKQIEVRPISAVRRYTDLSTDPTAAGREQKVDAVLEGSIQKSGDAIRVTVRLIRIADAAQIWTEKFDESFTNIFTLQDAISERVSQALAVKLTGEERQALKKRYTDNAEAYQLYLIGRNYYHKISGKTVGKSVEYFQKAIEKDPNYALAYAGLAEAYTALTMLDAFTPNEGFVKVRAAATKALELDDSLGEAHTALAGMLANYDWNWVEAEAHFKRAIELNPNDALAHHRYSSHLVLMGRSGEAITETKRARELDPFSTLINGELGRALYGTRQYDQAIAQLRITLEMDPQSGFTRFFLGLAYLAKTDYPQAISELKKSMTLGVGVSALGPLGYAYAVSGKREEALKLLAEANRISRERYVPYIVPVMIYMGLGDKDRAFEYLEKAFHDRQWHVLLLKAEPLFDNLRADQRCTDILKRMGL
jgi:serine/threonine-protein kinase